MQFLFLLITLLFLEKASYFRPPTDFPPRSCLLQLNLSRFFNQSSYGVLEALPRNPPLFWVFSNPPGNAGFSAFQERRVVAALFLVLCSWGGDSFCLGDRCWSARERETGQPPSCLSHFWAFFKADSMVFVLNWQGTQPCPLPGYFFLPSSFLMWAFPIS